MTINEMTDHIIGAAIEVHRRLGPGLLESVYEVCLASEVGRRGLRCERQRPLSVAYNGEFLDAAYRIDLYVENAVVVEIKSVARLEPVHKAQMLTYLKLSGAGVGLLINFNVSLLKDGITRVVLKYEGPAPRAPRPPR